MGVRNSFFELLSADATLTELVGDRIYPVQVPQDQQELPAIIYWVEDNDPDQVMAPTIGPDKYFIVCEIRTTNYNQVDDLADAVDGAARNKILDGNRGTVVKVLERDIQANDVEGSDSPLFSCHIVYAVTRTG